MRADTNKNTQKDLHTRESHMKHTTAQQNTRTTTALTSTHAQTLSDAQMKTNAIHIYSETLTHESILALFSPLSICLSLSLSLSLPLSVSRGHSNTKTETHT